MFGKIMGKSVEVPVFDHSGVNDSGFSAAPANNDNWVQAYDQQTNDNEYSKKNVRYNAASTCQTIRPKKLRRLYYSFKIYDIDNICGLIAYVNTSNAPKQTVLANCRPILPTYLQNVEKYKLKQITTSLYFIATR